MDLAHLLHARVTAMHECIGAPVEPFDVFTVGEWEFFPLGPTGALGIKSCPELDGDALIVALPIDHSRWASARTIQIMRRHMEKGRNLYTLAWHGHVLAININNRVGGVALGIDSDGFIHYKHTLEGLVKTPEVANDPGTEG
jgi:hypothetical protein